MKIGTALLAVLAAACSSTSVGAAPSPPSSPSSSPTSSRPPAVRAEPVVAVVRASGAVELYAVEAGPTVRRLRTLPGPRGMKGFDVSLAAGADPKVCAAFSDARRSVLQCYDAGAETGTTVAEGVGSVALSASGETVAWTDATRGDDVFYEDGAHPTPVRVPALAPGQEPEEAALVVGSLAWEGDDTLLVSHGYDDDVNGAVARVRVADAAKGWTNGPFVPNDDQRWPVLSGVTSASTDGTVLAVQLGFGDAGRDMTRAVRLEARTGRVVSVVSVAAQGRRMRSVSGGPGGVLYRTEGDGGDVRTYWRAAGQPRGQLLGGLPADTTDVVAQP